VQGVRINGAPVYLTSRLKTGDLLQLWVDAEQSDTILPEPIPVPVVHEDASVLVVNKPAGLVVHPAKGHYTGTLANGVVHHWRQIGIRAKFRPVHRLDQFTSGLLVIAKDPFAHSKLTERLKRRLLIREYLAVVHGVIPTEEMTIEEPIGLPEAGTNKRIVHAAGKSAVTRLRVVERLPTATIVRLRLETGRTHQIRVHMEWLGHPLFGDPLYGIGKPDGIDRQALHAIRLGFQHPQTDESMEWTAEIPCDMQNLIQRLR
jgi:23S rRNA pseudouridine1911/1915/1917 synthase